MVEKGWEVYIKRLFIREGTERRREESEMENIYYAWLYDILQQLLQHAERRAAINHLKAKVVHPYRQVGTGTL